MQASILFNLRLNSEAISNKRAILAHMKGLLVVVDARTGCRFESLTDYFDYRPRSSRLCLHVSRYHQIEFGRNLLCVLINRKIMK